MLLFANLMKNKNREIKFINSELLGSNTNFQGFLCYKFDFTIFVFH